VRLTVAEVKYLTPLCDTLRQCGLTLAEIGTYIGVTQATIGKWLNDTLEVRCKRSLSSSETTGRARGHKPCTATVPELIAAYTGRCQICGIPEDKCNTRFAMDHCHDTGRFRGWLCKVCNAKIEMSFMSPLDVLARFAQFHLRGCNAQAIADYLGIPAAEKQRVVEFLRASDDQLREWMAIMGRKTRAEQELAHPGIVSGWNLTP